MTKSLLSILPLLFLLFSAKADLVAHYALDETGPSTLVTDCLGNNHGTLIGSATPTKGFPSPHATGNDGSGIRIDLGSSGNKVRALLRDGNGSSNTSVSSPLTLSNGNWYFFALRYDSLNGTCKLTVLKDTGGSITSSNIASATTTNSSLGTNAIPHNTGVFIAADDANAAGSNDFGGALDDFAIFQTGDKFGVLSDADLAEVYNTGALAFDPPAPRPTINSFTANGSDFNSGDSVILNWNVSDASGSVIENLTYNDEHPWPEAPDGGGFSLVRISPANKLPPNNPTSWRSSTDLGGNPGTTDSTTFPGGDLLDYSLQEQALIPIVNGVIVPRNLAADDLIQVLQTSTDLLSWTPLTKPISESPQLPLHPTNLHSLPLDSKTLLPPKSHPPLTLPIKSHSNHPANDL